jgi:hypothetical protein
MRVRCRAIADYRSNAVGLLELECTPEGLRIALCGVSSYREGYAPGLPVHASDTLVPWPSVYATRVGDESLLLSVDAQRLPLNRFLLGDFSEPPPPAPMGLSRWPRALAASSLGAGLIAIGVGLSRAGALPHPRALGTLGMAAALVALVLGALVIVSRAAPRRSAAELLRELSHELALHLTNHIAVEISLPPPRTFAAHELASFLPRSVVGIAVTLAATTLAAIVGSSAARPGPAAGSLASSHPALLPTADDAELARASGTARPPLPTPRSAAPLTSTRASEAGSGAAGLDSPCECERDESLPWREPLPRLSPLVLAQSRREHDGHHHTQLEVALVNDGAEDVAALHLSVVFFEEGSGARAGQWQTGERPLYFAGPLAPGHLAKWHVEGRGTSFDIIAPDHDTLAANGSNAAPAEAFAALAREGPRAVRLHATRLLAFLGDARAEGAARSLRSTASPAESDYLDRIAAPPRDVAACRVDVSPESSGEWRLEACLFNRSAQPRAGLGVRWLAFDAALDLRQPGARMPGILAEHTVHIDALLAPRSGRMFSLSAPLPLEPGVVPRAFEVVVDREENLP